MSRPESSRANGEHDFTRAKLSATRIQDLWAPNWSAYMSLAGQYAFDPLLASEEFALGGPVYGRAYDAGEENGIHYLVMEHIEGSTVEADLSAIAAVLDAWVTNFPDTGHPVGDNREYLRTKRERCAAAHLRIAQRIAQSARAVRAGRPGQRQTRGHSQKHIFHGDS